MAFNFGQASTPGQTPGFSFGAQTQQQQAAPAFGAPSTAQTGFGLASSFGQPASSGFGQVAAQSTTTSLFGAAKSGTLSFSQPSVGPFGSPATTQPAFSLGQVATNQTFGGFGSTAPPAFSQIPSTSAPTYNLSQSTVTPSSFVFGGQQQTASPAFSFNPQSAATSSAPSGLSSGSISGPTFGQSTLGFGNQQSSSSLSFGGTTTIPVTTSSGILFGQTSQPTGSISFGQSSSTSTPGGLNFGQSSSGHSFGLPASTGLSFSSTPTSSTDGLSSVQSSAIPSTTATPLTFGFGQPAATTPASSAPPAYSFSTPGSTLSSTSFSLNQPTASTAPAGGFSLGLSAPSTTAPPASIGGLLSFGSTSTTSAPIGISFGSAPPTLTPPVTTPASNASPAFQLGQTPVVPSFGVSNTSVAPTPTTSAAPSGLGGFSFGNPTAVTTTTAASIIGATSASLPVTTTITPTLGFSFGTAPSSSATTSAATSLTQTPTTAAVGLSTSTTSTTSNTTTPATTSSVLTFRQLEESINKWSVDLDEQEKVFLNQANSVAAWDRLLVNNGEKIVSLSDSVNRVKKDQVRLESELDFVRAQQRELEEMLVPLEESLKQEVNNMPHDAEREHTYQLAENIDSQMRRLADDLKEIIERMNASTRQHEASTDPIAKIARILNAHTDSLQWAESSCTALQRKLDDVARGLEQQRRDQDRSYRFA